MKKIVYIAVTAALVVAFAFALVACNDDSPTTANITDNDIVQLRSALSASSDFSSYRAVITEVIGTGDTQESANTTVSWYTNGSRQNTIDVEIAVTANGTVRTTYIHAGENSAGRLVYAQAQYENGELSSAPSYNDNSTTNISRVLETSGALTARNDLLNIISENSYYTLSGTVTSYSNGDKVYSINYDDETHTGIVTVTVSGGVITRIAMESGSDTLTTDYTYNIGSKSVMTRNEWNEAHSA